MSGSVSVKKSSLESGIKCCKSSIEMLNNAAKKLRSEVNKAHDRGWKDEKSKQLALIIDDSVKSLENPVQGLNECLVKLEKLLDSINEYENLKLWGDKVLMVKASPETIRESKNSINSIIKSIEKISTVINTGLNSTSDWNDDKGMEFKEIMRDVAKYVKEPLPTLQNSSKKMDKLASALDRYNSVKF